MRCIAMAALGGLLALSVPAKADILIDISKSQQKLAVIVDGTELYRWPVSTGRRGHPTPGGTFHPIRLERHWYSHQYELTPMPWAMFFYRGYAVHGTMEAYNLGHPASHGCVRLRPDHAEILFSLVHKHKLSDTKVVVMNGPLPAPAGPGDAPMADAGKLKVEAVAEHFAKALPENDVAVDLTAHYDLGTPSVARRGEGMPLAAHARTGEDPVKVAARGNDASVMRSRQAWLTALAHKYGFSHW